jgi:hypothetical protein
MVGEYGAARYEWVSERTLNAPEDVPRLLPNKLGRESMRSVLA